MYPLNSGDLLLSSICRNVYNGLKLCKKLCWIWFITRNILSPNDFLLNTKETTVNDFYTCCTQSLELDSSLKGFTINMHTI